MHGSCVEREEKYRVNFNRCTIVCAIECKDKNDIYIERERDNRKVRDTERWNRIMDAAPSTLGNYSVLIESISSHMPGWRLLVTRVCNRSFTRPVICRETRRLNRIAADGYLLLSSSLFAVMIFAFVACRFSRPTEYTGGRVRFSIAAIRSIRRVRLQFELFIR